MPRKIPGKNGGTLTVAEKGDVLNPYGRPRKTVSLLKKFGYLTVEVKATMKNMMGMKRADVINIAQNPNSPMIEGLIAKSLIKGFFTVDQIISIAYGDALKNIPDADQSKKSKVGDMVDLDSAAEIYHRMIKGE